MSFERFTTLLVHLAQDSFHAAINIAIKGSVRLTSVKSIKKIFVSDNVTDTVYNRWRPLNGPLQRRPL